jgi:hypothetical protein
VCLCLSKNQLETRKSHQLNVWPNCNARQVRPAETAKDEEVVSRMWLAFGSMTGCRVSSTRNAAGHVYSESLADESQKNRKSRVRWLFGDATRPTTRNDDDAPVVLQGSPDCAPLPWSEDTSGRTRRTVSVLPSSRLRRASTIPAFRLRVLRTTTLATFRAEGARPMRNGEHADARPSWRRHRLSFLP